MIYINHNLKAIFIHIPKTGGSYIGPTLVKYYGFQCYLELLNKRRLDHDQVCVKNLVKTGNPIYDSTFLNKSLGILTYCRTSEYLSSCMNMNEEKWNNYTKFCFIRHPYDRLLSGWNHIKKIFNYNILLKDYINKDQNSVSDIEHSHIFFEQYMQIMLPNGECGVDIIGRFEYLEQDFIEILKKIGVKQIIHIPKKVNVSRPNRSEKIILNSDVIRRANEIFKNDFEKFHYKKYEL